MSSSGNSVGQVGVQLVSLNPSAAISSINSYVNALTKMETVVRRVNATLNAGLGKGIGNNAGFTNIINQTNQFQKSLTSTAQSAQQAGQKINDTFNRVNQGSTVFKNASNNANQFRTVIETTSSTAQKAAERINASFQGAQKSSQNWAYATETAANKASASYEKASASSERFNASQQKFNANAMGSRQSFLAMGEGAENAGTSIERTTGIIDMNAEALKKQSSKFQQTMTQLTPYISRMMGFGLTVGMATQAIDESIGMQEALAQSQKKVATLAEREAQAIEKYGKGSRQAESATRAHEDALQGLTYMQRNANFAARDVTFFMLMMATSIMSTVLPALKDMGTYMAKLKGFAMTAKAGLAPLIGGITELTSSILNLKKASIGGALGSLTAGIGGVGTGGGMGFDISGFTRSSKKAAESFGDDMSRIGQAAAATMGSAVPMSFGKGTGVVTTAANSFKSGIGNMVIQTNKLNAGPLRQIPQTFAKLGGEVSKTSGIVGRFLPVISRVAPILGPIGIAIAIVTTAMTAYQSNIGGIRDSTEKFGKALGDTIPIFKPVGELLQGIAGSLGLTGDTAEQTAAHFQNASNMFANMGSLWNDTIANLQASNDTLVQSIGNSLQVASQAVVDFGFEFNAQIDMTMQTWDLLWKQIEQGDYDAAVVTITDSLAAIPEIVGKLFEGIGEMMSTQFEAAVSIFKFFRVKVTEVWNAIGDTIRSSFGAAFDAVAGMAVAIGNRVMKGFQDIVGMAGAIGTSIIKALGLSGAISAVQNWVSGIQSVINNLVAGIVVTGQDIWNKIISNPIASAVSSWMKVNIVDPINLLLDQLKRELGQITAPAKKAIEEKISSPVGMTPNTSTEKNYRGALELGTQLQRRQRLQEQTFEPQFTYSPELEHVGPPTTPEAQMRSSLDQLAKTSPYQLYQLTGGTGELSPEVYAKTPKGGGSTEFNQQNEILEGKRFQQARTGQILQKKQPVPYMTATLGSRFTAAGAIGLLGSETSAAQEGKSQATYLQSPYDVTSGLKKPTQLTKSGIDYSKVGPYGVQKPAFGGMEFKRQQIVNPYKKALSADTPEQQVIDAADMGISEEALTQYKNLDEEVTKLSASTKGYNELLKDSWGTMLIASKGTETFRNEMAQAGAKVIESKAYNDEYYKSLSDGIPQENARKQAIEDARKALADQVVELAYNNSMFETRSKQMKDGTLQELALKEGVLEQKNALMELNLENAKRTGSLSQMAKQYQEGTIQLATYNQAVLDQREAGIQSMLAINQMSGTLAELNLQYKNGVTEFAAFKTGQHEYSIGMIKMAEDTAHTMGIFTQFIASFKAVGNATTMFNAGFAQGVSDIQNWATAMMQSKGVFSGMIEGLIAVGHELGAGLPSAFSFTMEAAQKWIGVLQGAPDVLNELVSAAAEAGQGAISSLGEAFRQGDDEFDDAIDELSEKLGFKFTDEMQDAIKPQMVADSLKDPLKTGVGMLANMKNLTTEGALGIAQGLVGQIKESIEESPELAKAGQAMIDLLTNPPGAEASVEERSQWFGKLMLMIDAYGQAIPGVTLNNDALNKSFGEGSTVVTNLANAYETLGTKAKNYFDQISKNTQGFVQDPTQQADYLKNTSGYNDPTGQNLALKQVNANAENAKNAQLTGGGTPETANLQAGIDSINQQLTTLQANFATAMQSLLNSANQYWVLIGQASGLMGVPMAEALGTVQVAFGLIMDQLLEKANESFTNIGLATGLMGVPMAEALGTMQVAFGTILGQMINTASASFTAIGTSSFVVATEANKSFSTMLANAQGSLSSLVRAAAQAFNNIGEASRNVLDAINTNFGQAAQNGIDLFHAMAVDIGQSMDSVVVAIGNVESALGGIETVAGNAQDAVSALADELNALPNIEREIIYTIKTEGSVPGQTGLIMPRLAYGGMIDQLLPQKALVGENGKELIMTTDRGGNTRSFIANHMQPVNIKDKDLTVIPMERRNADNFYRKYPELVNSIFGGNPATMRFQEGLPILPLSPNSNTNIQSQQPNGKYYNNQNGVIDTNMSEAEITQLERAMNLPPGSLQRPVGSGTGNNTGGTNGIPNTGSNIPAGHGWGGKSYVPGMGSGTGSGPVNGGTGTGSSGGGNNVSVNGQTITAGNASVTQGGGRQTITINGKVILDQQAFNDAVDDFDDAVNNNTGNGGSNNNNNNNNPPNSNTGNNPPNSNTGGNNNNNNNGGGSNFTPPTTQTGAAGSGFEVSQGAQPNTASGPITVSSDDKIHLWDGSSYTVAEWNQLNDNARYNLAESDDVGIKSLPKGVFLEEDYSISKKSNGRTTQYVNNTTYRTGANAGQTGSAYQNPNGNNNTGDNFGNTLMNPSDSDLRSTSYLGGGQGSYYKYGTGYYVPDYVQTPGHGANDPTKWNNPNMNPNSWHSEEMKDRSGLWKVVDDKGVNIAAKFKNKQEADEFIQEHITNYTPGAGTGSGNNNNPPPNSNTGNPPPNTNTNGSTVIRGDQVPVGVQVSGTGKNWQGNVDYDISQWQTVKMKDDPSKWKVIDKNGRNVAAGFESKEAADEWKDTYRIESGSGQGNNNNLPPNSNTGNLPPNTNTGGNNNNNTNNGVQSGNLEALYFPDSDVYASGSAPAGMTYGQTSSGRYVGDQTGVSRNSTPEDWFIKKQSNGKYKVVTGDGKDVAVDFNSVADAQNWINFVITDYAKKNPGKPPIGDPTLPLYRDKTTGKVYSQDYQGNLYERTGDYSDYTADSSTHAKPIPGNGTSGSGPVNNNGGSGNGNNGGTPTTGTGGNTTGNNGGGTTNVPNQNIQQSQVISQNSIIGQGNNSNIDIMSGTNSRLQIQNGNVISATGIFAGYNGSGGLGGLGSNGGLGNVFSTKYNPLMSMLTPPLSTPRTPNSNEYDGMLTPLANEIYQGKDDWAFNILPKTGSGIPNPGGNGSNGGNGGMGGGFGWIFGMFNQFRQILDEMVDWNRIMATRQVDDKNMWSAMSKITSLNIGRKP